jgi:hypothetical protein
MSDTLSKQIEFQRCVWKLLRFAETQGFGLTFGDAWDADGDGGHMKNSLHSQRLAIDLNLFVKDEEGKWTWVTNGSDEAWFTLGLYWEHLHDNARWGGRFKDANHFSFADGGRS